MLANELLAAGGATMLTPANGLLAAGGAERLTPANGLVADGADGTVFLRAFTIRLCFRTSSEAFVNVPGSKPCTHKQNY